MRSLQGVCARVCCHRVSLLRVESLIVLISSITGEFCFTPDWCLSLDFPTVRYLSSLLVIGSLVIVPLECWLLGSSRTLRLLMVLTILLNLKLAGIVLWPASLVDNFLFDDFLTLSQLLPLNVFLDGKLHAFCNLLLLLSIIVVALIVAGGHGRLRRWYHCGLKPWFVIESKTSLHTKFLASLTDLWREGTFLHVFFKVLRVLVLVLAIDQFVAPKLVYMFHS